MNHSRSRLRIATYNVRNLFDEDGAKLANAPCKTSAELKALVGTLAGLRADVILLQEIGSQRLLSEVNDRLPDPYPVVEMLPGNSNRGIHLAVVSRERVRLTSHRSLTLTDEAGQALGEYESEGDAAAHIRTPLRIQRDLMLAELQPDGLDTLALFNVHLKSKTNRDWRLLAADNIRSAESRQIAAQIERYLTRFPQRPVLLGGDFNDTRNSEAVAPIFGLPLSDPLGETLAQSGRNPSTYWPKRRMRLDYLLVSAAARSLLVKGSAKIHGGERARRASDHYPVSLDLHYRAHGERVRNV